MSSRSLLARTLLGAAPVLLAASGATAQPAGRPHRLVQDIRLDAVKMQLRTAGAVAVGPQRQVVIGPTGYNRSEMVALDSTGTRTLWRLKTGRDDDFEISRVDRMGFSGNTLWVVDGGFGHTALVDAKGKVTRSLENPSWIKPSRADVRKFPVFGAMQAHAWYADNTLLIIPREETSLLKTPEFDKTRRHLVRINPDGIIQRAVAKLPLIGTGFYSNDGEFIGAAAVPVLDNMLFGVSPDGGRIVAVVPSFRGKDSATFHVAILGERGDTVGSKRYPFKPVKVSQKTTDSLMRQVRGEDTTDMRKRLSPIHPPFTSLRVGADGSVWLGLPAQPRDTTRQYLVLDTRANPVAQVTLRKSESIAWARLGEIWVTDRPGRETEAIVRYKVVPR